MAKVEFPKPLKQLLDESDLEAPLRALADRVGEILADNKLPFFPDYTDHGTDHINRVLKSEIELVPKQVWKNSGKDSDPRLLYDADAAVIIGGTLLHDIAMHLRAGGFLELVSENSRFQPLPWFSESHEGQSADRPWQGLWEDFIREARRFSERALTNIIGEESAGIWKFHELPADTGQWERNHCLIVGEFIRRHHARLAHEIAIYGFPGIPVGSGEGQFPAMGKEEGHPLMRLADLIGLTARSHGISLRVCKSYLESSPLYPGTPRPMGTAVLYPMAVLRVADYLQIDRQRAPAVLLQLRNPQSPISIQEWKKHRAVQNIGPATNPRGRMVTVSTDLSLTLYLQLENLLAGLQAEMDHSTAVLDETYGTLTELGLNQLNLAARRVYSNLHSPAFRDSLPYVPNQTGFTSDPNLLTLLVEPLYGKQPGVGVRELMQNAIDAVWELETWSASRGASVKALDLPEQACDVLIEFIKRDDGSWFLRVRDRGIGMSSDTIENYFLRAGASFRRSGEWAKEFLDGEGHPRVTRAGRFGVGVFAVFLLGSSFRLWTRHVADVNATGYEVEASVNSQLIEIRRVDGLKVGTTIEVELSDESTKRLELEAKDRSYHLKVATDWFCLASPKIIKRVVRGKKALELESDYALEIRRGKTPADWAVIYPKNFDAVYWTFSGAPSLICNGLRIGEPEFGIGAKFDWPPAETQLKRPNIAVFDSAANLPLNVQRYGLSQPAVPFIDDLSRDVILSFIGHALVCGPTSQPEALSNANSHPLLLRRFAEYGKSDSILNPFSEGLLRWCSTSTAMVPADRWLYGLLKTQLCFLYGSFFVVDDFHVLNPKVRVLELDEIPTTGHAILPWHAVMVRPQKKEDILRTIRRIEDEQEPEWWPVRIFTTLAHMGVAALGHNVRASKVLVSSSCEIDLTSAPPFSWYVKKEANFKIWQRICSSKSREDYFEAVKGNFATTIPLLTILENMSSDLLENGPKSRRDNLSPDLCFVSEIKTKRAPRSPDSLIAKIWNECLGARAIPFDPRARAQMIVDGCKHPELKRHIGAWQVLKRDGSKWAAESSLAS